MQLLVRSLSSTFVVSVDASASVADLKKSIEDVSFYPTDSFVVRSGVTSLSCGSATLAECGVAAEDTVTVTFDVDGGMRAKWRKKRMRRLRRKRRKMRQRAR